MPKGRPGTYHTKTVDELFDQCIPEPNSGCWVFMGPLTNGGYGSVRTNGKNMNAQRAMFLAVTGTLPAGKDICHKCDVRSCINPAHLFVGTRKENLADMTRKGRRVPPRGERAWKAKLTAEQVLSIRAEVERGDRLIDIAARYGVTKMAIGDIKFRRNWKHI